MNCQIIDTILSRHNSTQVYYFFSNLEILLYRTIITLSSHTQYQVSTQNASVNRLCVLYHLLVWWSIVLMKCVCLSTAGVPWAICAQCAWTAHTGVCRNPCQGSAPLHSRITLVLGPVGDGQCQAVADPFRLLGICKGTHRLLLSVEGWGDWLWYWTKKKGCRLGMNGVRFVWTSLPRSLTSVNRLCSTETLQFADNHNEP